MRILFVLIVAIATSLSAAVPIEPRDVGQLALQAWKNRDAEALVELSHPDLKKRFKDARVLRFYVESRKEKEDQLANANELQIAQLLCDALDAIVPKRSLLFEYFDDYVSTEIRGNYAIITFDSGWRSKSDPLKTSHLENRVVLKKSDDQWLFLWSPAVSIHVDLDWEPEKEMPPSTGILPSPTQLVLSDLPSIGDKLGKLPASPRADLANSGTIAHIYEIEIKGIWFDLLVHGESNKVVMIRTRSPMFKSPEGFTMKSTIGEILAKFPNSRRDEVGWGSYVHLPSGWDALMLFPGDYQFIKQTDKDRTALFFFRR